MFETFKIAPPFHADHVGSLLRPAELTAAHRHLREGKLSPKEFSTVRERAIREVVELQEQAGLESITDGEFRRASYWSHFVDAIEGMTVREALFVFRDDREKQKFTAPHTTAKLRRTRPISVEELSFLKSVTRQTPKITMPSPATMHFWLGRAGVDPSAYPITKGNGSPKEATSTLLSGSLTKLPSTPIFSNMTRHARAISRHFPSSPLGK